VGRPWERAATRTTHPQRARGCGEAPRGAVHQCAGRAGRPRGSGPDPDQHGLKPGRVSQSSPLERVESLEAVAPCRAKARA
jgi:hypothetical protein